MSTPYSVTPVGAAGLERTRTTVVLGPQLGPSYAQLADENQRLRAKVEALEHAAEKGRHWFAQWEAQVVLRMRYQERLVTAARVLHAIEQLYPHTQPVIDRARQDIWS